MMKRLASKQQVLDNYAKDSYISNQTVQSKDILDSESIKTLTKEERERLHLDVIQPADLKIFDQKFTSLSPKVRW